MSSHPFTNVGGQPVRVKVTGPFGVALQFVPVLQQFCLLSVGDEQFLFCSSHLVGSSMTAARIKGHLASDASVDATIVSGATIAALGLSTTRTAQALIMEAVVNKEPHHERRRELRIVPR